MRACRICGQHGTMWVLVAITYPEQTKTGRTVGIALCSEHLPQFEKALARFKPEEI